MVLGCSPVPVRGPRDRFLEETEGLNLLHLAVQAPSNRTEIVQPLLSKGLDPLGFSEDGRTMLHHLLSNPVSIVGS